MILVTSMVKLNNILVFNLLWFRQRELLDGHVRLRCLSTRQSWKIISQVFSSLLPISLRKCHQGTWLKIRVKDEKYRHNAVEDAWCPSIESRSCRRPCFGTLSTCVRSSYFATYNASPLIGVRKQSTQASQCSSDCKEIARIWHVKSTWFLGNRYKYSRFYIES